MSRQGMLAAAVAVAVSGCGVGMDGDPQSPQGPATRRTAQELHGVTFNLPHESCRVVSVRPDASGTIRSAPRQGMLEVAPVGDAVQSMYFDTQALGPESRRGVVMFSLPPLDGHVTAASLSFTDQHGYALQAVQPDLHVLEVLAAPATTITASDFASEASPPLGTFTTDLNTLAPVVRTFDVTSNVALGQGLGFRIAMEKTPTQVPSAGSAFVDFHVDVTLCDEGADLHTALGGHVGPAH